MTAWKTKILIVALIFMVCFGIQGCGTNKQTNETLNFSIINGKTLYFQDQKDIAPLRDSLEKLLANETRPIYDDTARGELMGYEAYDPHATSVMAGYSCGLFDATGDGVPELLVHPMGYFGSSGTATYFIYDIATGDKLGSIDGGNGELWCVYYNTETDELCTVGRYWLRFGWPSRTRFISTLEYDKQNNQCYERVYLSTKHDVEHETEGDNIYEIYPNTDYYVYGDKVSIDDYYDELDCFTASVIPLLETQLQMIPWNSVCEDNDDRFVRAEKMADALVSSSQKFVTPRK